jgi:PAS domain S-box-containing protein
MKTASVDLKQLRGWCLAALVFWSLLINGSLCLFVKHEWQSVKYIGKEIGIGDIHKDYVYRLWNAGHGGVYVPVTDESPPNPYLSDLPHRDLTTTDGKRLTLINPAYMTRQIYELEETMYGIRGHITSLDVIRPENAPDQWEKNALLQFQQGVKEVVELVTVDNKPFIRVMVPMETRAACLKCHAEQGYKEGDTRGGISITVPIDEVVELFHSQFKTSALYHLLIYLIGLSGLVVFYFQTSRQLAKRAHIEETLSVQEQYSHGIVDNISNGIAVYEADQEHEGFIVKSVNPAGMRIAQLDQEEEITGRDIIDVFPGVLDSGLLDVLRRILTTGEPEHFSVSEVIVNKSKEKAVHWLEYYVYKLPTGEIVAVYEDVTSRKLAKEQLLKKTAEWENTFNAIPDIITIQDENMRIIRANQSTFDFFQLPPGELLGSTCHSLFRGEAEPCPGCPGVRSIADLEKHCSTVEHKAMGRFFHVCSAPVLDTDNEFLYFVYIAHDITDKKKLEDELLQAQKMEAIGTLAGGIAHDFNNILAAILGYTELAKMELPKGGHIENDLNQVIIAGNRATDLVKQILTFSRKNKHQKKPLQVYLIVKEAVKMLRSSLPATIDIQADIDQKSGLVLADPTNIHQIIFNLCTNGSHAIGTEQGILKIMLQRVELNAERVADKPEAAPGGFVKLTVQDTGKGMDEMTMGRIFDPYFTTKEQGDGTGLGLAVTHGIVEDCHGFIEVESILGKGTTFHVYLPSLAEGSGEVREAETDIQLPTGDERILFVDDEAAITHISRSLLSNLGYSVTAEMRSTDALKKFQEAPESFDLLITDHTMPDLTGSELARIVLELRPDLPVILCTGYTAAISDKEALALGIKRYAVKPLTARKLAETVREVLDESDREAMKA